jgi:DNA polymerase I-like protein with 3'-5' exonuclease and polymerase domains
LWAAANDLPLGLNDNLMPLRDWLIRRGLRTENQFTDHIAAVETRFWDDRFPIYAKWKKQWHKAYLARGYFDTLTGFRCQGPMRRNECINYPVQGSAFHCLLWSLIQLHRWLTANEMNSTIIGQIHDSLILNLAPGEATAVLTKARKIMCHDIRRHWPWIIVPLDIEAEIAPPGKSWNDMESIK